MKILSYTPSKKQTGSLLGYLKIEVACIMNGRSYPMSMDVSIMRNSNNGHLFVGWPSKAFQTPEGTTKYAPIIRWVKDQVEDVQKEVVNEFQKYIANKNQNPPQQQSLQQNYMNPPEYPNVTQADLHF